MKIALLADAHCNSVGLAACLQRIEALGVGEVYFLGDAVGYLSGPGPVVRLLRESGALCQKGNHEAMLLGELPLPNDRDRVYRLALQRDALEPGALESLRAWPETRELHIGGARILLSHGSPAPSLTERIHRDTPWQPPDDFAYDAVFIGHTHRPFVRREADVLLVNVGSCGLPRDRGDMASFVVYDGEDRTAEMYRVSFDVGRVLELHGDGVHPDVRALFDRRGEFDGTVL